MKNKNKMGTISLWIAFIAVCVLVSVPFMAGSAVRDQVWYKIVLSGCEAALVGGIADLFAVTALFRDVPVVRFVPFVNRHMNILAKNRDSIINAIEQMVHQFINGAQIAKYLGSQTAHAPSAGTGIQIGQIAGSELKRMVETRVVHHLIVTRLSELSDRFSSKEGKKKLESDIDRCIRGFEIKNPAQFVAKKLIMRYMQERLYDDDAATKQKKWDRIAAAAERDLVKLAGSMEQGSISMLDTVDGTLYRQSLLNDLADSTSITGKAIQSITEENLGPIIQSALKETDIAEFVSQYVSNDLQYIRLNGAVVGGMTGLALEGIKQLLGL